jgi:hypothetical protein
MAFSFNDLNLSGVDAASGGGALQPGRHICKVTDAAIRDTRTGGKQLEVTFQDVAGTGSIRAFLNVHVPSSADATRIGREQLKALLVHGGHQNPDRPGDIRTVKGLTLGVAVKAETYEKNGETRSGSKVHYFFDPKEEGYTGGKSGGSSGGQVSGGGRGDMDDEIPF